MDNHFLRSNQSLWGFSIYNDGKKEHDVSKFKADTVRNIMDHCFDQNIEIHFMPNNDIPFAMLKNKNNTWFYLTSEHDANCFMKNILVAGSYELCQIV